MSVDAWVRTLPGRCRACGLHIAAQGHTSPCPPSGPLGVLLAGRKEGEARKRDAFAALDETDAANELALICREIVALGRRKIEFTPDDLPDEIRERTNPNRRGRAFSALLDDGTIREVSRIKSANPRAHGKKVGVYRLVAA